MYNQVMLERILSGHALDVSGHPQTSDGHYILPSGTKTDDDTLDFCVAHTQEWVRSIGRDKLTGQILASTSDIFYDHPGYECLWLR